MQQERRRYPRFKPEPSWTVRCANAEFESSPFSRQNVAVKMLDISAKGLCIVTVGRLREGVSLFVEVAALQDGSRFRGKGVVRWSQSLTHKGREAHVAGVELMEVIQIHGEKLRFLATWDRTQQKTEPTGESRPAASRFLDHASITCLPRGFWKALGLPSRNVARRILKVRPDGLRLDLRRKLEPGLRVEVRMDFTHPPAFVSAEGDVESCRRDTLILEPHWITEVRFRELTPENLERLEEILKLLPS